MAWKWDVGWFVTAVAALFGIGIVRGLLKILTPVATVGVVAYGIGTLLFHDRRPDGQQRLPAVRGPPAVRGKRQDVTPGPATR